MSVNIISLRTEHGDRVDVTRFSTNEGLKLQIVINLDSLVVLTQEETKKLAKGLKDSFDRTKHYI